MPLPPLCYHCASFGRPLASIERSWWRPLCLHSATTANLEPPWQWFCLHPAYYCATTAPFTQGCDLRATFERPEKWPGRSVVAQTQKVLFLCNCCSTTLVPSLNDQVCCSGATGRAKEAEWRQDHCQGG